MKDNVDSIKECIGPDIRYAATFEDIRQCKTQLWLTTGYALGINGFIIGILVANEALAQENASLLLIASSIISIIGLFLLHLHIRDLANYRKEKIALNMKYNWHDHMSHEDKPMHFQDYAMVICMAMAIVGTSVLLAILIY